MSSITRTIGRQILTTAVRAAWTLLSVGRLTTVLGERLEAWADGAAHRQWHDIDDVLQPLINTAR
jgi:hypothetical protein